MIRRLLPFLLVCVSCVSALRGDSTPLTLDKAFDSVDDVNVNVLIGREAIAQALASANRERAELLPQISLDVEQRRTHAASVSRNVPSRSPITNRFDGQLTGNLAVLSPSQIAAYRAARRGVGVAEFDYRQILQNVLTSVAETFFQHQRNLQRIVVLEANVERSRALLDLAQRQLNAGVATQIDVTRAEAQLAVAQQARLQQDTTVVQSELLLKRLLDLDPGATLTLAPFSVQRVDQDLYGPTLDRAAFDQRADYLRAQKALEQNRELLRSAKYERLGSVNVFGEYGYTSAEALDGKEVESWLGGVSLSVPVFDGLRTSANTRSALAQVRAQEYRIRSLELLISSELRLAAQDARSRFAQVRVAERTLQLAEDELTLARRRYEQGVADNREVVEAQNRLAQASDNLVEAVYQYNLSRLDLARAKGDVKNILNERAQ